jgi:hypothetical protein
MGVPYNGNPMSAHAQHVTIRNARGAEMLSTVSSRMQITDTVSTGDRRPLVVEVGTRLFISGGRIRIKLGLNSYYEAFE